MFRVSQDMKGLRMAAMEMFDFTLLEGDIDRQAQNLLKADPHTNPELVAKLFPRSLVSPGYHQWINYLLWLEDKMNAGVEFADLTADEAEGLALMRRVRLEWKDEHPACAKCSERVRSRTQRRCRRCNAEFN